MSNLKKFKPTAFKVQRLLQNPIGGKHQYYGTADLINYDKGVDDNGVAIERTDIASMRKPEAPEALLFYLPPLHSNG